MEWYYHVFYAILRCEGAIAAQEWPSHSGTSKETRGQGKLLLTSIAETLALSFTLTNLMLS